jgi:hypothetical protein
VTTRGGQLSAEASFRGIFRNLADDDKMVAAVVALGHFALAVAGALDQRCAQRVAKQQGVGDAGGCISGPDSDTGTTECRPECVRVRINRHVGTARRVGSGIRERRNLPVG